MKSKKEISFLTPDNQTVWISLTYYQIRWKAELPNQKAVLLFSDDGGKSWTKISDIDVSQGNFEWKTPSYCSDNYLLRIEGKNKTQISGTSHPFRIVKKVHNELIIWDNLAMDVYRRLTAISKLELEKRIKIFRPRFIKIQEILIILGKALFRAALLNKINEKDNDKSILKEWDFYFFPGYISNQRNRIFIEGGEIPKSSSRGKAKIKQGYYFTGIGGKTPKKELSDREYEIFIKQIIRGVITLKPNWIVEEKPTISTWYMDTSTTKAFHAVLNKYYFEWDYPKSEPYYCPGSMAAFKNQQNFERIVSVFNNAESKFKDFEREEYRISLRLKKDSTDLRFIHISLNNEISTHIEKSEENILHIEINTEDICRSGELISEFLSADKLPINWKLRKIDLESYEEKIGKEKEIRIELSNSFYNKRVEKTVTISESEMFIPFPFNGLDFDQSQINRKDEILEIQKKLYSYWITQTFFIDRKYRAEIRKFIKEFKAELKEKKFNKLANRIKIYNSGDSPNFNHFYTIFLDGFNPENDLGTIMLLTSHPLSQTFLLRTSSWVRWIYSMIQVLETNTLKEHIGRREGRTDFIAMLSHPTNTWFNIIKGNLERLHVSKGETKKVDEILARVTSLKEILNFGMQHFLARKDISDSEFEHVELLSVVKEICSLLLMEITFFKGKSLHFPDPSHYSVIKKIIEKQHSIFEFDTDKDKYEFKSNPAAIKVLLKEIITNAVEYSINPKKESQNRLVKISIKDMQDCFIFECTNYRHMNSEVFAILNKKENLNEKLNPFWIGLRLIQEICKEYHFSLKPTTKEGDSESTSIEIIFNKNGKKNQ
jgi:hypothetical protein